MTLNDTQIFNLPLQQPQTPSEPPNTSNVNRCLTHLTYSRTLDANGTPGQEMNTLFYVMQ